MKGIIQSNLGDGRYVVSVDSANSLLSLEIARLTREYDAAQAEVTSLLGTVDTLEGEYQSALWAVYTAADAYRDCLHSTSYEAQLEREEEACDAAKDVAYAKCGQQYQDLPSIMVCRARADREYQQCMGGTAGRAEAAWRAHGQACFDQHHGAIVSAQTRAANLVAGLKAARDTLHRAQAKVLAAGMRRQALQDIQDRNIQYTVWQAQRVDDLAEDDPVEIATTPAGRHVVTGIVAQSNCLIDSRALPSNHLFIDAALMPGAETWRPTWRTGVVLGPGEEPGTLRVQFDPAEVAGSLGTDKSRTPIDCTPPQAYFDGDWQAVESGIESARLAVEAAQVAAGEARQALTDAIAAAAADRDAAIAGTDQACLVEWTDWLTLCLEVDPAPECHAAYDEHLAACQQDGRDAADLLYQAAVATLHGVHDPLIAEADAAVTEAIDALRLARSMILGPANPLILECPVEHCEAGNYEVDDTVLIDFPVRTLSPGAPLAVWDSRRVIGWADSPRVCGLRIEPGLFCLPPVRDDIVYPWTPARPDWLETWAAGPGVAIPGSSRTTVLLGNLTGNGAMLPPYDWPDGADYQGRLYPNASALAKVLNTAQPATRVRYPATAYSGWAQLWVEACLASGRLLSDRVPPDCTTAPGALGLIWSAADSETGLPTAWAIDLDARGLWAWEMECPGVAQEVLASLAAGDYTGDAAHLGWLYVLADLRPVGGQDAEPVIVLSDADLADAYADGGPLLMAGWLWGPYSTAAASECRSVHGDVWLPGQAGQGFQSREVRVVVSCAAGAEPTATVTAEDLAYWRPEWGYDWILVGAPDALSPVRGATIYPGQDGCSASAPMWGLWTETGTWEVWRYYRPTYTGGTAASTPWVPSCSTHNSAEEHSSDIQIRTGGAGREPPPGARIGTGTTTTRTADISVGDFNEWHSRTSMWLYGVVTAAYWCGCDWSTSTPAPPMPPAPYEDRGEDSPQTRENGGIATGTAKVEYITNGGAVTTTIYDPSQPAAVWQKRVETADALRTNTVGTTKWVGHEQQNRRTRLGFHGYSTPAWINVKGEPCGGQMAHPWYSASSVNGITGGGAVTVSNTTVDIAGVINQTATLYFSGSAISGDPTADGWSSAAQGGTGPWQAAVAAMQSARGSAIYRAEPGGDWQSDCGISAGDAAAAHTWAGG